MFVAGAAEEIAKRCSKCGEQKRLDDFHRRKYKTYVGYMSHCKGCSRAKTYLWRSKNKKKWSSYVKKRWDALSPEARAIAIAKRRAAPSQVARDERRRLSKLNRKRITPHEREQLPHVRAYRRAYRARPERVA